MRALGLFVLAGLAEIGGGWLVWQWLREHKSLTIGLLGGAALGNSAIIARVTNRR